MTVSSLIFKNLKFYRKPHLALLAVIVVSTAVLTGALMLGDSVKYSLNHIVLLRLGNIKYSMEPQHHLFRASLANDLQKLANTRVVSISKTDGILIHQDSQRRINKVKVYGVNSEFFRFWSQQCTDIPDDEVWVNKYVADKLHLQIGSQVLLRAGKIRKYPLNTPFASEKQETTALHLTVGRVIKDDQGGRFSLETSQTAPFNVFVSIKQLQEVSGISGFANTLLFEELPRVSSPEKLIDSLINTVWELSDIGIRVKSDDSVVNLSSDQVFVPETIAAAFEKSSEKPMKFMSYLANSISGSGKETPYSFVTAVPDGYLQEDLHAGEMVVNDWMAEDLHIAEGAVVTMKYFVISSQNVLKEESSQFRVVKILPVGSKVFDPSFMPDYPGLTQAGNCRDWETGVPVDLKRIRGKDEIYWRNYRGKPKALISLEDGRKRWTNPFGSCTLLRTSLNGSTTPEFVKTIMNRLNPKMNGFVLNTVYQDGIIGAANSTDFGGLFLSLSTFILISGFLLLFMMYSLHIGYREEEFFVLKSLGFPDSLLFKIYLLEISLVSIVGTLIGVLAGAGYQQLLIYGLNTLWTDAVGMTTLELVISPSTLVISWLLSVLSILFILIFFLLKRKRKQGLNQVFEITAYTTASFKVKRMKVIAFILTLSGIMPILYVFFFQEIKSPVIFMISGFIIMTGLFFGCMNLLYVLSSGTFRKNRGLSVLVMKNIIDKRKQAWGIIFLLALGTFCLIITSANRRTYYGEESNPGSGTGGFLLWAETTVPLPKELHSGLSGELIFPLEDQMDTVVKAYPIYKLSGTDASCLNLNQVNHPTIMGINPVVFNQKHAFSMVGVDPKRKSDHPWLILTNEFAPSVLPAFADESVINWGLHKSIGDTVKMKDSEGNDLFLILSGALDNSIFQGNILISDNLFARYFPGSGRISNMLISGKPNQTEVLSEMLETTYKDYGMMVTTTSQRLAAFNAVQNTYLSVFMLLGGIGLLIGTFGFGFFLLRSIQSRYQEIAVYKSIGFSQGLIFRLLFSEYLFLFFIGIGLGLAGSAIALLPSVLSPAFVMSGKLVFWLVIVILASGIAWVVIPVRRAVRKKSLSALRMP